MNNDRSHNSPLESAKSLRLLVVEDSATDAELIIGEVRRGYPDLVARQVKNESEMRSALNEQTWDLVISDYCLPAFDGLTALRVIQQQGLDLPFLIISGAITEETAVMVMRAGAHDYLVKDKLARLLPVIDRELRDARVRRERGAARSEAGHLLETAEQSRRALLGMLEDQKEVSEALRESEWFLRSVIDALMDGIALLDEDGTILLVNHAWREFAAQNGGDSSRVSEGVNYLDVCDLSEGADSDGAAVFAEGIRSVFSGSLPVFVTEYSCDSPDKKRWFAARVSLFPGTGPRRVVVAHEDITERKLIEQDRESMQSQLIQSQKMESVGRLAGGVAHDYNNMLSVIVGYAELALEQNPTAEPLREYLEEILKAARRSTEITRQLLAFARKQPISPVVLDLNETVSGMLRMLHRLIGEDIELSWIPESDVWPVKIDPVQIDQILVNLCVNARDAITVGGQIVIETDKVCLDEGYCRLRVGFVPGEFVMLAVSDNGCGMDSETVSRIFEPFFTTKELGKGTGLGMATVYGIVKQNNGFIDVSSEPGIGTITKIYFPRFSSEASQTNGAAKVKLPQGKGETVLVVEDEVLVLSLAERILSSLGYKVLCSSSPEDAITLACSHIGEIQLLLTDMVMPGMNGRELAAKLQALFPGLRCLFMSGYTANVIASHSFPDGTHFIQKPLSITQLAPKIRQALGDEEAVG